MKIDKMFLSIGRYIFYNKYEYYVANQKYNDELKAIPKDWTYNIWKVSDRTRALKIIILALRLYSEIKLHGSSNDTQT